MEVPLSRPGIAGEGLFYVTVIPMATIFMGLFFFGTITKYLKKISFKKENSIFAHGFGGRVWPRKVTYPQQPGPRVSKTRRN